jgi:branched-chain amino acid transport system permease protein
VRGNREAGRVTRIRVPRPVVPLLFFGAWIAAGQAVALAFGQHRLVPVPQMGQSAISGCLTAMFAVGLVLVYRANRIINFAHAAVGFAAGSLFMMLVIVEHWNYWLAAGAVIVAALVTGLLIQTLLVRRFANSPRLVLTVVTICVGQIIGGIGGSLPRWMAGIVIPAGPDDPPVPVTPVHSPLFSHKWEWAQGVILRGDHALALLCTVVVLLGIAAFFRFTSAGIAVRGAAENEDRAAMLGINPQTLSTVVWVMAAGIAALAGIAQVSVQGATLPTLVAGIGGANLLRALTAAVLARMENLPVAVASAIGISIFERCVFEAFSQTALIDAFLLLAVVVALLAQRKAMARTEESGTGTWSATEEVRPIPAELRNVPAVRQGVRRLVTVLVVVGLAYPWVMSPSQTNLGSVYAIFGIVGVSLVILTGWGGQISLGQFAFVAVGAAVGGSMTGPGNLPFPLALLGGSLAGAALAVVLGLPALRIKGLYLAVTTLAFASATTTVLLNPRFFDWLLPEPSSIHRPKLLFINFEDERAYYYFCAAFLALTVLAALGLRRTRTGRVLIAMRDNERTAQSFGVSLVRTRLVTFAISGFIAAMAGVLYAHHQHAVAQSSFRLEKSLSMFTMAVIGGLGSVPGALLGAIYLGTTNLVIKSAALQLLASGGGGLLVLLFFPSGLSGVAFAVRDAWLRRIAIRERIWVPSLLGDFRLFGEDARVALAPKGDNGHREEEVPVRYRVKSRIGVAGESQQGRGWEF